MLLTEGTSGLGLEKCLGVQVLERTLGLVALFMSLWVFADE